MFIRRYTLMVIVLIVLGLGFFGLGYQYYHSMDTKAQMKEEGDYFRFARAGDEGLEVYRDDQWEEIQIRGVELSSFRPGYGRYKTDMDKELLMNWLGEIQAMGANLIKIPHIQPPSFYNAIYDYNEEAEEPIYTLHEILLDENAIMEHYDIYNKRIWNNFRKDIRKTINVVHGRAGLFSSKRNHTGIYIKDISDYNLGFILGTNTNPETISLSNIIHEEKKAYRGEHISVEEANASEVFMAEMLDYAASYEMKRYEQLSLLSYLTTLQTDPMDYRQESNQTKSARIDMDKIQSGDLDNLFVAYRYHPNGVDFLDYEYCDEGENKDKEQSDFSRQLERIDEYYSKPVLISETGISSSRAISNVDIRDGYNRGGFSEEDQGKVLVELLKSIEEYNFAGTIIRSWQDDWSSVSSASKVLDYLDESASSFWYNAQDSDESFGLISFQGDKNPFYLDGDLEAWEEVDYLIDDELKLRTKDQAAHLYILIEKEGWDFENEELFLGLDLTPKSGSLLWEDQGARFASPVDFIIHINGEEESRVLVHERYNLFNYLYKYYDHEVDKQRDIPPKDGVDFQPIYILNRKRFFFPITQEIIEPIYYETGKLRPGVDNPDYEDFNSLADFKAGDGFIEIKIPWELINVINPMDMLIFDDFYLKGVEKSLRVGKFRYSIYDKEEDRVYGNEAGQRLKTNKKISEDEYRLKSSYFILKEYWGNRR